MRRSSTVTPTGSAAAIQFLKPNSWWSFSLHNSSRQLIHLLQDIQGLSEFQKHTLITRYITVTESIYKRSKLYTYLFHIGRTIVSVGSLIVPALLSIQYTSAGMANTAPLSMEIYWATWCISLLVTMFNGILAIFKVDKQYYFLHTIYEHLQSELWQYIYLSGKYGGHYTKGIQTTHANQYVYVCHNLEKIKLKQVEEEYYKLLEHTVNNGTNQPEKSLATDSSGLPVDPSKVVAGLYTPTPNQQQLLEKQVELATAIGLMPKHTMETRGLLPKNTLHSIQGAVIDEKTKAETNKTTATAERRGSTGSSPVLSV
jgi:hypothetical protein